MRIALIYSGRMPMPGNPPAGGLGAVENILWNYKKELARLGHTVDIYNSPWIQDTIYALNTTEYDFIHCHYELFVLELNKHLKKPYCLTSHSGALSKFQPGRYEYYSGFNYSWLDCLEAPGTIALSEHIKKLYLHSRYKKFLRVLPNPVETDKFHFAKRGNGRAICLGRIQTRKRQAAIAKLLRGKARVDFVGHNDETHGFERSPFVENETCKYLGSWEREEVYKKLTNYSCLVHLPISEVAAPLVVLEALAAGVSVVTNQASSANLTDEEFITVLPDSAFQAAVVSDAVEKAIAKNAALRPQIRQYALQRFDYSVLVPEYLRVIDEFRSYAKSS